MSLFNRKNRQFAVTSEHSQQAHLPVISVVDNDAASPVPTEIVNYERVLLTHLLSGGGMLETVRDALLLSSDKLRQEQLTLKDLNSKNDIAMKSMKNLEWQIAKIATNAQQELSGIEQLQISLTSIHQCIGDINRISRQTDLLAINSAIEAAHVGSEGRGFAVIAKEITTLSAEVQHQSARIVTLTEDIGKQAQQLCEEITQQVPLVQQMQHDLHEAGVLLSQVIQSSTRMQSIISIIATQQFLNTVKMDHVIWKYQVYRYLLDRNREATVNTHTECRLGKWYYSNESVQYANYNGFTELEQFHMQVHSSGREALDAFFKHEQERMEKALERMESASHQVVSQIDKLMGQITDKALTLADGGGI